MLALRETTTEKEKGGGGIQVSNADRHCANLKHHTANMHIVINYKIPDIFYLYVIS